MGAWGRDQKATGIVRMMADGSADFTKALGLDVDFTKHGMGMRSQRYSMLVDDGVVKQLNVGSSRQVRGVERGDDAEAAGVTRKRAPGQRRQRHHQPGRPLPESQQQERCRRQHKIGRAQDGGGPHRMVERRQQRNHRRIDSGQRLAGGLVLPQCGEKGQRTVHQQERRQENRCYRN